MNPVEQIRSLKTLTSKEIRRFFRIWQQALIPSVITTILYFVIFGTFIGNRIGLMGGFEYMQFMAPGLIMLAVITNSYANVASAFYGAKFQKAIEEILISPMPNWQILIGFVMGGVARGVLVGIVVVVVSLFFTSFAIDNLLLTLFSILITSALFSILGLINGVYAKTFDDVSIVPTFVLTPLIYLGGIFYSIEILGEQWQFLSKLNPILYIVNFFRYAMLGTSEIDPLQGFSLIVVFTVIFFALAYYLLHRGTGIKD